MTLLKDLVWHSALRCRDAGEVEVGGSGGGGSFAHLVEDAGLSYVWSDWGFQTSPTNDEDGTYAYVDPIGQFASTMDDAANTAFKVDLVGEPQDRLAIKADGSLHWGDGTDAPDTHLSRDGAHQLLVSADDGNTGVWLNDVGRIDLVAALSDASILKAGVEGEPTYRVQLGADGTIHWGDGSNPPDTSLQREGQGNGLVAAGFYVGDPGDADDIYASRKYADVEVGYLELMFDGRGQLLFQANHFDGQGASIAFGDGTAPPDITLSRGGPQALMLQGNNADTNVFLGAGDNPYVVFQLGPGAANRSSNVFGIYPDAGGGDYSFAVNQDGSMHWGDGAAAPDVSLERNAPQTSGLAVSDHGGGGLVVVPDASAESWVNYAWVWSDYSGDARPALELRSAANDLILRPAATPNVLDIDGNGGGIRIKAPNGTAYNVTVNNAGAVIATAA